jgi:hypothetical protein
MRKLRAQSLEAQKKGGSLISVVEETLGGLKVIKVTMLSLLLKVDLTIQ